MPHRRVFRRRPRVIFPSAMSSPRQSGSHPPLGYRPLLDEVDDFATSFGPNKGGSLAPTLFTSLPVLRDALETETSFSQDDTVEECLPYLAGTAIGDFSLSVHGLPKLQRRLHKEFLLDILKEKSKSHVAYDASRPWLVYWALTGLCLLGEDVTAYKERCVRIAELFWKGVQLIECRKLDRDPYCGPKRQRRLWWRPWTGFAYCSVICCGAEPGHGRGSGNPGHS